MIKVKAFLDQVLLWLGLGVITAASLIVVGFVLRVYAHFFMLGWDLL